MVDQKNQTELDLFGEILSNGVEFARQGFASDLMLHDGVQDEYFPAGEMFQTDESGRRWILSQDSLPGDLAIKAVAVDCRNLFLEISPVDLSAAGEALEERRIAAEFLPVQLRTTAGRRIAVRMSASEGNPEHGISPRQLWAIPWKDRRQDCELAIRAFDAVYTAGAYLSGELDMGATLPAASSPRPEMQMRMSIQLQLQQEQRPVLLLEGRPDLLQVQRLELRGIMGLQNSVLQMTPDELERWAHGECQKPSGARKVYSVIVFTLAGRIRRVQPSLNWREARTKARRLIAGA